MGTLYVVKPGGCRNTSTTQPGRLAFRKPSYLFYHVTNGAQSGIGHPRPPFSSPRRRAPSPARAYTRPLSANPRAPQIPPTQVPVENVLNVNTQSALNRGVEVPSDELV